MWAAVISFLLQLLLLFIKKWVNKDDQSTAFAELGRAQEEAVRTKSSRPLRDLLAKWKAIRQAEKSK